MRNILFLLGSVAITAVLAVGCSGPEHKLGRGLSNMGEIVRLNEMQRSVEEGGLFYGTDTGITTGLVQGFDRTIVRTGLGIFEVVTFPLPPYRPLLTSYLAPKPEYPDSFAPRKWDEPVFYTDYSLGFDGGDIAPWMPGSRFRVFDN